VCTTTWQIAPTESTPVPPPPDRAANRDSPVFDFVVAFFSILQNGPDLKRLTNKKTRPLVGNPAQCTVHQLPGSVAVVTSHSEVQKCVEENQYDQRLDRVSNACNLKGHCELPLTGK
jgi:hypothetical protein